MLITPSFKKSLIVEQFQGNYLKCERVYAFSGEKVVRLLYRGGYQTVEHKVFRNYETGSTLNSYKLYSS